MSPAPLDVTVLFGTRPEAIKMAPVIHALRRDPDHFRLRVCVSSQHRLMLQQALEAFDIRPDVDLGVMTPGQSLSELTAQLLSRLEGTLCEPRQPDWLLVQGDTTTTFAGALSAFYRGVRVGHVEAGLRTHDSQAPFPEEVNRRVCSLIAERHWAPTPRNRDNLLAERVPAERILVTGNTSLDALRMVTERYDREALRDRIADAQPELHQALVSSEGRRLLLATVHRRESFGEPLQRICQALRRLTDRFEDCALVYPVHLNPRIDGPVRGALSGHPRIHLVGPVDYLSFVALMQASTLILTDAGGVQEEGSYFDKPVLVLREVTERPEAIASGATRLVGRDAERIVEETARLLTDAGEYERMARAVNPYGDGRAAARIVASLRGAPVDELV